MRDVINLSAEARAQKGKGPAFQLRQKGSIPAIIYGGKGEPQPLQVDSRSLGKIYSTGSLLQTIIMLDVGGKKTRVIPREIQLDPVSDRPIHVDFMRLEPGARIRIAIPVRFKGHEASPGIKLGGVVNVVRHEIELYCSADNLPEYIEANLEGLGIGDSLHIGDIALPEGVKPVIARNFTVASIAPPTTYVEEAATTTAAAGATAEGATAEGAAEGAAPAAGAAAPAAGAAGAGAAAPAAAKGKAPAAPAKK